MAAMLGLFLPFSCCLLLSIALFPSKLRKKTLTALISPSTPAKPAFESSTNSTSCSLPDGWARVVPWQGGRVGRRKGEGTLGFLDRGIIRLTLCQQRAKNKVGGAFEAVFPRYDRVEGLLRSGQDPSGSIAG